MGLHNTSMFFYLSLASGLHMNAFRVDSIV